MARHVPQISFEQGSDAAWKIAYIQIPILSAFASFWFTPNLGQRDFEREDPVVDPHRVYAIFALTGLVHLILVIYFLLGIVFVDWGFPDRGESFASRVDTGARMMVFLSSLAVLPVGYVLRIDNPSRILPTPDSMASPPATPQPPPTAPGPSTSATSPK